MSSRLLRIVFGAVVTFSGPASAEETCTPITRGNVATCVVRASAAIRAEREATAAAAGRRLAASPWFPSNPTLAVSLARRAGTEGRGDAINYTASLSQEIEVAGQRAARRRAAEADIGARTLETIATSRRVAADGYTA